MKAKEAGRKTIKVMNYTVNLAVLTIIMLLIAYAGYALWDSNQMYHAADKTHYAKYKPTAENQGKTFKELQTLNPEVIAWLSVYGTNIDYPVTQGQDNTKYVNTNAEGLYSLSGAIFLNSENSKKFDDFNSILYGHHMDKSVMFGELGNFADKKLFDAHRYGNLYFDEKDHGIEFFVYIHTSAYDSAIFKPGVNEKYRQAYLNNLIANAMHIREIGVTAEDQIILLSTCSSGSTNGRDILIGRITDEVYEDPFLNKNTNDAKDQSTDGLGSFLKEIRLINILLAVLLIVLITVIIYRRKKRTKSS